MVRQIRCDGWPHRSHSTLRVLDPACGDGRLLTAIAREFDRTELVGCDIDAQVADAITDDRIELVVADGLDFCQNVVASFDLVIANPPFLSQMASLTSRRGSSKFGGGPYANVAMEFCRAALDTLKPGGRMTIVLPQSSLASRDSSDLRASVSAKARLIDSHWSPVAHFDASVTVAVLTFERREVDVAPDGSPWTMPVVDALGIPPLPSLRTSGSLGDIADAHSNFRDEYYALVPAVSDDEVGPPLITSGLIDPGQCHWGTRPVRFAKTTFLSPRVNLDMLNGRFPKWAERLLRPKVLVAAQTRIIEAVADREGLWLPGVPVISVVPTADVSVDAIAAYLTSPIPSLIAWHTRGGTGLSSKSVRLSPQFLLDLPLPATLPSARSLTALAAGDLRSTGLAICEDFGLTTAASNNLVEWWLTTGKLA